jgi:hypothetical protein
MVPPLRILVGSPRRDATAATKRIGATSPAARDILRMMPVSTPGRAAGNVTIRNVRS